MAALYDLLADYASVSIIGMCKNAGKTTVLNHLLEGAYAAGGPLGLTSIGRDGEDTDLVTGTQKPGIWVHSGTLVATAANLLKYCDITREILEATGIPTPLGEVVVVRALSDGAVQLAGPSMVSQLARVNELFFAFGARQVFIDGAISRKSLCSRRVSEATVLCTGASCGRSLPAVLREAAHFAQLATLPEADDARLAALPEDVRLALIGAETLYPDDNDLVAALRGTPGNATRLLFIGGALTDGMLKPLITSGLDLSGLTLVVRDASKLLITHGTYQKLLAKKSGIRVVDSVNLAAVTVNPFSAYGHHFEGEAFRAGMAEAVGVPVFDVMTQQK